MHNVRVESCLIWGKMRTIAQETVLYSSEKLLREVGERVSIIHDSGEGGGTYSQAHILAKSCC